VCREVDAAARLLWHKPAETSPATKKAKSGRSWTQPALDQAIRNRRDNQTEYHALVQAVEQGEPGATEDARKLWGRNVLARELEVRSSSMVSRSKVYQAIQAELRLEQHKTKTRGRKVGLEIAMERKAVEASPDADSAPAESAIENRERAETLRLIEQLANSGRTQAEKARNKEAAAAIAEQLRQDDDDDRARKIIQITMEKV